MDYEWDENKNRVNRKKHGLSFDDAEIVFSGPVLTVEDTRRDYGEQRFSTLGMLVGRVVYVVHTQRGTTTRIISMRKANAREKKIYQERLEKARRPDG